MRSASCVENETLRERSARARCEPAPDIARAISRLALQRGGPRDLGAVRDGLAAAAACARPAGSEGASGIGLPEALAAHRRAPAGVPAATCEPLLAAALVDEPPHLRRDGGFVRPGLPRRSRRGPRACATTAAR